MIPLFAHACLPWLYAPGMKDTPRFERNVGESMLRLFHSDGTSAETGVPADVFLETSETLGLLPSPYPVHVSLNAQAAF